jgi:hypothetical protein
MALTRREFMERSLGATVLTAAMRGPALAQGYPGSFALLIGGLCFHDSDDDDDYRIWMPRHDPDLPHRAVLIKKKADGPMEGDHPRTDVSDDLESVPLDGCEVTVTSFVTNPKCVAHKDELTCSYQLPYPEDPGTMASWSGLDWFMPCRKFLNNKLGSMQQRNGNSAAVVHMNSGTVGAIWPVGERDSITGRHEVKLWEISIGGKFKAARAIPNWALANLPGSSCVLTLKCLKTHSPLGSITLTGEAAIAFLPVVRLGIHADDNPSKHFKLFDPILKPHKEVTIVHRGATFPLQRKLAAGSLDERVSKFLDKVECLVKPKVKSRDRDEDYELMTAGSTACPPCHDP